MVTAKINIKLDTSQEIIQKRGLEPGGRVQMILADEPTGNLDEKNSQDILKTFIDLAHKNNKCVIIVTHSPSLAKKCDVQLKIMEGQIVEI